MPRAVAVVAHFDDALIWAGGAIRRTRALEWEWTIVTTCAAEHHRRAYVESWCASLGAHSESLRFVDHPDGEPFSRNDRAGLLRDVGKILNSASPDWLFTHSLDDRGEYGRHPNHAEAADVAVALARAASLKVSRVAHFAYCRVYGGARVPTVARLESTHYLALDYDDLRWKAEWCARANSVESADPSLGENTYLRRLHWPCPNPEAFSGDGLALPPPFAARSSEPPNV